MIQWIKRKIRNKMEKIILIHYLNVGNMGMADCAVYKDNYMRALPKEDGM